MHTCSFALHTHLQEPRWSNKQEQKTKKQNKKQKKEWSNECTAWLAQRAEMALGKAGGTACPTCTHRHGGMDERRRARVLAETMRAAAWGAHAEHTHTHTHTHRGANGKEEEEEE